MEFPVKVMIQIGEFARAKWVLFYATEKGLEGWRDEGGLTPPDLRMLCQKLIVKLYHLGKKDRLSADTFRELAIFAVKSLAAIYKHHGLVLTADQARIFVDALNDYCLKGTPLSIRLEDMSNGAGAYEDAFSDEDPTHA